ncbi:hypothetical protein POM88_009276 [Heracleum sosnowskyi]|uniref:Transposase MuDR plant domain-containing protein n=1 Tax=Heracleum sosnowskyi TaxID=360622 RepID=A0AAD8J8U6_9APIA|nr:hypothetical protein POM88_009276 [Heracleum sosnowskyi]
MDKATIKLQYDGKFVYSPHLEYIGGLVKEFVDYDIDLICYFELTWLVKENAGKETCGFFFGFFFKPRDKVKKPKENGNVFDIYCDHGAQTDGEVEIRYYNQTGRAENVDGNLTDVGHQVTKKPEECDSENELEEELEGDDWMGSNISFDDDKCDSNHEDRKCLDEFENDNDGEASIFEQDMYFNTSTPVDEIDFYVGLKFANHKELRHAVKSQAIAKGYVIEFVKSEEKRVLVTCKDKERCKWRLWATTMPTEDSFQIKTLQNEHTCIYKKITTLTLWTLHGCQRSMEKESEKIQNGDSRTYKMRYKKNMV